VRGSVTGATGVIYKRFLQPKVVAGEGKKAVTRVLNPPSERRKIPCKGLTWGKENIGEKVLESAEQRLRKIQG